MTAELTEQQLAAIQSREVEVLCEAGAGSGKTEVLVRRCLEALLRDAIELQEVLAITFTDRAAEELRERLRLGLERAADKSDDPDRGRELRGLARETEEAWFSTIHGFCRRILAANPVAAGVDPGFGVLDDGEAGRLKKRAFSQALATLAEQQPAVVTRVLASNKRADLQEMVTRIHGAMRADGTAHPELPAAPRDDPENPTSNGQTEAYGLLRSLLSEFDAAYQSLKARRVGLDFEDLELRALSLLETEAGDRYRDQFKHLLVDEFQDTNRLQLKLISSLVGPDTRRFLVGDELQSIYGFRDADVEILRGERRRIDSLDDSEALLAPLTGNFRSHAEVLAAVNAIGRELIEDFTELAVGSEDQLAPSPTGDPRVELLLTRGDPSANTKNVKGPVRGTWKETDLPDPGSASNVVLAEARMLASRLAELRLSEPVESSFVVLVRKRTHVETLRRALEEFGLDPHVIGGKDFWQGQQVRDVLSLMMLVSNPLDDTALLGALASPACGASPDALWALRKAAGSRPLHFGLLDLLGQSGESDPEAEAEADWGSRLDPGDIDSLGRFQEGMERMRAEAGSLGLSELIDYLCREFGYDLATLMRQNGAERWANVRKLQRIAGEFEAQEGASVRAFLEYVEDESERSSEGDAPVADASSGGVTVMTIHKAKGLEFDVVAVPQLGTGLGDQGQVVRIAFDRPDEDPTAESELRIGLGLKAPDAEEKSPAFEMEALKDRESYKQIEEEMRLFHVAATRARQRLLLSGAYTYDCALAGEDRRVGFSEKAGMIDRIVQSLELTEPEGSETDSFVEVAHPSAVGDLEIPEDEIRIAVRWNFPGDDAASRLAPPETNDEADRPDEDRAGGAPPSPVALPSPSTATRFSFSSLSVFERCGYRFYAERELGLKRHGPPTATFDRSPDPDQVDELPEATSGELTLPGEETVIGPDQAILRFGPGNALHRLLEWSALHGWKEPTDSLLEEMLHAESLLGTKEELLRVRGLVDAWLGSEILASIRERGLDLTPEMPFVLAVGDTMINGSIDLVASDSSGGEVEIVDYKTNSLRGRDPEDAMTAYRTQREIYALAASEIGTPVTAHYLFLEDAGRPVTETYDEKRLTGARERISGLLANISRADFRVTEHPHRALCHDCPAFRLCPHPREARERKESEPAVPAEVTPGSD